MQGTKGVRAMECYRQGGGRQQVPGSGSQTNVSTGARPGRRLTDAVEVLAVGSNEHEVVNYGQWGCGQG